jgi:hypothetical protein
VVEPGEGRQHDRQGGDDGDRDDGAEDVKHEGGEAEVGRDAGRVAPGIHAEREAEKQPLDLRERLGLDRLAVAAQVGLRADDHQQGQAQERFHQPGQQPGRGPHRGALGGEHLHACRAPGQREREGDHAAGREDLPHARGLVRLHRLVLGQLVKPRGLMSLPAPLAHLGRVEPQRGVVVLQLGEQGRLGHLGAQLAHTLGLSGNGGRLRRGGLAGQVRLRLTDQRGNVVRLRLVIAGKVVH